MMIRLVSHSGGKAASLGHYLWRRIASSLSMASFT
ncbi:unnamed protein product [Musa acuminata subsp. malaccensis]|uniref:(wild Malaysian banana) hypothetical protein n=1 Tax=Musa acuminata subsp. malaccensis TaxID=214687 RepID=A0A804JGM6_MUSAM|nr:unnamed protein product [Musa acuminata subsp. malaccensis]